MDLIRVTPSGTLLIGKSPRAHALICAIGRSGMIAASEKREGDGASPVGRWPLRRVHYRADRLEPITTHLPLRAIQPDDGWCDAPEHPQYNSRVQRPFPASHEILWRDDAVYDVIVELGHNDDPTVPGAGSAIFMHVAKPDYSPTEGCIALALADLLSLLVDASTDTLLEISF